MKLENKEKLIKIIADGKLSDAKVIIKTALDDYAKSKIDDLK